MSEHLDLHFGPDLKVGHDAVRCRPADAAPVVQSTWQPAYARPRPVRDTRNANRVTLRGRLLDLGEALLLTAATWIDARTRRRP